VRQKLTQLVKGAINLPGSYPLNQIQVLGLDSTLFFQSRFINDTNVAQTRFISGLKGDLPFLEEAGLSNWAYDVNVSYSRSSGQDSVSGVPYFPRLAQTINNTTEDANGNITCADDGIPREGQTIPCRPLDFLEPTFLFTGEFDNPEDTAYLFPNRLTDTIVKQNMIQGYMSGDLFDVPTGGTVIAGFGGEYREDIIETRTSLAGDFLGFFNDPGSNGRRTLHEVFGEIEVPLVKERYGIHELSVNLAGRYTDESNFGSAETYSVKGVFAPTDWLSFRGTYGTSFRAPNLGEQFGGSVTGFANPSDPCRVPGLAYQFVDTDNDPNTPNVRIYDPTLDNRDPDLIARCTNGGGPFGLSPTDPTRLGLSGYGTSSGAFFGAPTRVATGSNPALKPETSTAISVGGSFDQPWFEDFDFRVAVNYFEIEITDEVNQLTASTIVNRCYNSAGLTDPTCEFIDRDARDANDPTSG
jgi:iron complex outermembrane receptor protein